MSSAPALPPPPTPSQHREILRLAVPAFLTLIAEPLFLLADTAIVGHLGTSALAGLGVASSVLLTAAGVFVFLAYGTTAIVARQLGAGSRQGAVGAGIDGTWLAIALGLLSAVVVALLATPLCRAFGASPAVVDEAVTYLRISAAGLPGMLVILATTGVLRGLQDTRTPLVASVGGFTANIALNYLFVYGFGMGIAGSAWGTVIAQTGMAAALVTVLIRYAVRTRLRLHPHPGRVLGAARHGIPLLIRTLALRAALLTTVWVAAGLGDVPLAAHQVAATVWSFLAFALDALAIAAQALTGKALGAGDVEGVRSATRLMIRWGIGLGVLLGAAVLVLHRVLPPLFTPDASVQGAIAAALVVVALSQPISGYVFVIDGVLIGADDGRWLARAGVAVYSLYLPLIGAVHLLAPTTGAVWSAPVAVTWLWVAFTGFMVLRGIALGLRVRTTRWMVTGV
ncbi:MAG: MATE family efflux transporter [Dermatophilaceae bacterium]